MSKEKKHRKHYDFASADLIFYIWQNRIPLLIITALAAVCSVIVSLAITPLFRSTVTMFPATNVSVAKNLISESFMGRESIYEIGTEEQAEHLMQILNSEQIKSRIIAKYNLMEHYKIDPGSDFPRTRLAAKFRKNIKFRRTEYMSVIIDVLDKDPDMAANIANDIASLTDTVFNHMLRQRAYDAYLLVQNEYFSMIKNLQHIQDSLDQIRQLGVNNYETQAERYYEAYGKAVLDGNPRAINALEQKIKTISKYGGAYVSLSYQEKFESERLSSIRQRYTEAKMEAEQDLPHKFIVDSAVSAEKKSYPKKMIIVLVSTFATFLLALITLIIVDNLNLKKEA